MRTRTKNKERGQTSSTIILKVNKKSKKIQRKKKKLPLKCRNLTKAKKIHRQNWLLITVLLKNQEAWLKKCYKAIFKASKNLKNKKTILRREKVRILERKKKNRKKTLLKLEARIQFLKKITQSKK